MFGSPASGGISTPDPRARICARADRYFFLFLSCAVVWHSERLALLVGSAESGGDFAIQSAITDSRGGNIPHRTGLTGTRQARWLATGSQAIPNAFINSDTFGIPRGGRPRHLDAHYYRVCQNLVCGRPINAGPLYHCTTARYVLYYGGLGLTQNASFLTPALYGLHYRSIDRYVWLPTP